MEFKEAIEIAKSYKIHSDQRKIARERGMKSKEAYHEGCMKMALQIFESCYGKETIEEILKKEKLL